MVPARDGKQVPVSVVYHEGLQEGRQRASCSSTPMAPTAMPIPPSFSTARLSLLDRGCAYAIAHIRGGDDLGYQWFLDGKLDQAHQHASTISSTRRRG